MMSSHLEEKRAALLGLAPKNDKSKSESQKGSSSRKRSNSNTNSSSTTSSTTSASGSGRKRNSANSGSTTNLQSSLTSSNSNASLSSLSSTNPNIPSVSPPIGSNLQVSHNSGTSITISLIQTPPISSSASTASTSSNSMSASVGYNNNNMVPSSVSVASSFNQLSTVSIQPSAPVVGSGRLATPPSTTSTITSSSSLVSNTQHLNQDVHSIFPPPSTNSQPPIPVILPKLVTPPLLGANDNESTTAVTIDTNMSASDDGEESTFIEEDDDESYTDESDDEEDENFDDTEEIVIVDDDFFEKNLENVPVQEQAQIIQKNINSEHVQFLHTVTMIPITTSVPKLKKQLGAAGFSKKRITKKKTNPSSMPLEQFFKRLNTEQLIKYRRYHNINSVTGASSREELEAAAINHFKNEWRFVGENRVISQFLHRLNTAIPRLRNASSVLQHLSDL